MTARAGGSGRRSPRAPARTTPRKAARAGAGSSASELPRLYADLAWLWPILSPPEHYAAEARTLLRQYRSLVPKRGRTRPRLLDLGAGGGHLLVHLARHFDCTAVDLSRAMLENCARLVPSARRVVGDMRTLRLEERFDAVLIHDAVDYMLSPDDLRAALDTAAAHLVPGGALFVAPTYTRDNFVDGDAEHDADPSANLTYLSYVHDPDPRDTEYELVLVYLIRGERRGVEVTVDRHRCGLFPVEDWLSALKQAGFSARCVEDDKAWTLFAGTRVS